MGCFKDRVIFATVGEAIAYKMYQKETIQEHATVVLTFKVVCKDPYHPVTTGCAVLFHTVPGLVHGSA